MNSALHLAVLTALPLTLTLAGYWLAARLPALDAAERVAVATLAGLGALLWNIAGVGFFEPLAGGWAWLCLWPVAATLLDRRARAAFGRDFIELARSRRTIGATLLAASLLATLLWPLLSRSSLVFHDGTSNHDAFFWIVAAEHLMRHSYMELPVTGSEYPLMNAVPAIIGWQPSWGRMGGEGFLAITASLAGVEPVRIYLAATAALFAPWVAAVFLVVRTFLVHRLGRAAVFALVVLQPVFVYFHGNANLPNLLGALCAAAAVLATERILRAEPGRAGWLVLLALSVHGLLCSYPEMLPFVVMPAGLLWLRTWFSGEIRHVWRTSSFAALGWIAGLALNPASTTRGWGGFVASFGAARANQNWANLFDPLSPLQYVPALATLSVGATREVGLLGGVLLTIMLIVALSIAWRRASDRAGAGFILSGAGALLVYTMATGFNYGWQKTVQFGGPLWAAFLPVAIVATLSAETPSRRSIRFVWRTTLAVVIAFFAYATLFNCRDSHKWSGRKLITEDWFGLREFARERLFAQPVLVDGASFRMAFFHGMWATYFLPDSPLHFSERGKKDNGGYLGGGVRTEARDAVPPPAAFLVSREWADTFDANSPRLFAGDTVALLGQANRVFHWSGLHPDNGPPENAYSRVTLEVLPHSSSELVLVLAVHEEVNSSATWRVRRTAPGAPEFATNIAGPAPWRIVVPLVAGQSNHLELAAESVRAPGSRPPFVVREIGIRSSAR